MKRGANVHRCQQCGFVSPKPGTCPDCARTGDYVALVEERQAPAREGRRATLASGRPRPLREVEVEQVARLQTRIGELDRVLGGGVVPGSLVLIGGEPGIGKSTLLLDICAAVARRAGADGRPVLYVSGEESTAQIRLRAARLGHDDGAAADTIVVLAETSVEQVTDAAEAAAPSLVVVDSVQTLTADELAGPAGSVGQVRAVALALQDPLSNLFAGLTISLSGQIRIGDYVKLETGQEGHVVDFDWRTTRIQMLANNLVIVPNAALAKAIVTNYSLPQADMSVPVQVSVDAGSDLDRVERVTLEVARQVLREVPGAVRDFEPAVRFQAFGDSAIRFVVSLRGHQFADQFLLTHEFVKRLQARYQSEGIVMSSQKRTFSARDPIPIVVQDLRGPAQS